jgi:hypothetical protein
MRHGRAEGATPYIGDYPDGAYWSALPAESSGETPEHYTVSGDVIRFMWDYGVSVPRWDREELLPHEPEWLHRGPWDSVGASSKR